MRRSSSHRWSSSGQIQRRVWSDGSGGTGGAASRQRMAVLRERPSSTNKSVQDVDAHARSLMRLEHNLILPLAPLRADPSTAPPVGPAASRDVGRMISPPQDAVFAPSQDVNDPPSPMRVPMYQSEARLLELQSRSRRGRLQITWSGSSGCLRVALLQAKSPAAAGGGAWMTSDRRGGGSPVQSRMQQRRLRSGAAPKRGARRSEGCLW